MAVGFGLAAAALGAGLITLVSGAVLYRNKPPQGSVIFTPIARVRRRELNPQNPPSSYSTF
jgi:peptide/histidine transporter 3/4